MRIPVSLLLGYYVGVVAPISIASIVILALLVAVLAAAWKREQLGDARVAYIRLPIASARSKS